MVVDAPRNFISADLAIMIDYYIYNDWLYFKDSMLLLFHFVIKRIFHFNIVINYLSYCYGSLLIEQRSVVIQQIWPI